jgi:hypothetical protein
MEGKQQTDYTFPLASFLAQRASIQTERQSLVRERATWKKTRDALDEAAAKGLDERFCDVFEALDRPLGQPCTPETAAAVGALAELVAQGASARLLGNYELGSFNLAMAIRNSEDLRDDATAALLCRVVRLTIVANADLHAQKTYVGNGGCTSLEWLVWFLSGGWSGKLENDEHWQLKFQCCYTMFTWVLEAHLSTPPAEGVSRVNPLLHFLVTVQATVVPRARQEPVLLRLMAYGLSPVEPEDMYMRTAFFKRIAGFDISWIGLIFPYEQEPLRAYIAVVKANLTPPILEMMLNALTSNTELRRYFKAFFSQPHWLLERVAEVAPAVIFNLVRRNEQELLKPFLKLYRPALLAMRDAAGNTLLHAAVMAPGVRKGLVTLLLQSGFPKQITNGAGVTPHALAVKYKRKALIPLL